MATAQQQEPLEGTTMTSSRKAISTRLRRNLSRIGCLTVFAIVVVGITEIIVSSMFSPVRFTLTFEDRPIPDISSYQALSLHGAGFEYEKSASYGRALYRWFARALLANNLSMALTYRGYAQPVCRDGHAADLDLEATATEQAVANQVMGRKAGIDVSPYHLVGIISKVLPDGAPYFWNLPKIKGKCYSKVVWDAAYWDLVCQLGSEDEKRHILSVEADYDWGRRLRVNGHVPSIGFEKIDIGFRLVFRDGVEGPVFARLDVRYPNARGLFANDGLVYSSYDPIMRFVFSEMKKGENRGRTIDGRFDSFGVVDKVHVDGQDTPVLPVEISARPSRKPYFDLKNDVPDETYAQQYELREVKFSSGLKRIGACAFAGCGMLCYGQEGLRLPTGLESIGDGAFAECDCIKEVEIPSSVTNLGAWAFARCSALRHVTLPSGISEISDGLFYRGNNESGLEDVAIPASVRRIGKYAFASNVRLTEIELPESVEEIDDYAFYRCESLTNVVIRGGALKRIGEAAFWGCEKLKRPELPASVEPGEEAFGGWIP